MPITGVLCKLAADNTTFNGSANYTPVPWDGADIYDTHGLHSPSSNNTKIIIPAALNGRTGRLRASAYIASIVGGGTIAIAIKKNGVIISGYGAEGASAEASTVQFLSTTTHPITLATGDEFTAEIFSVDDSAITLESESCSFGLQVLGNRIAKGVLCKLNANQTAANYSTPAAIAWDGADEYDTDAAHDPASNNTKIIVPAAWNGKYGIFRVVAHLSLVASGGDSSIQIQKGASSNYIGWGGICSDASTFTDTNLTCATQPILLATGEEYTAKLYCSDTSITLNAGRTSFGCWIVG